MLSRDTLKQTAELFTNPLFKLGFFDFFLKMQQEGIEAARKFGDFYASKNSLMPSTDEMYERMIDFYIILGLVLRVKFEEVMKENANLLKEEYKFLRDAIRELQLNLLFTEGGEKGRQIWRSSIDKELKLPKERAKNCFELFRQLQVASK